MCDGASRSNHRTSRRAYCSLRLAQAELLRLVLRHSRAPSAGGGQIPGGLDSLGIYGSMGL